MVYRKHGMDWVVMDSAGHEIKYGDLVLSVADTVGTFDGLGKLSRDGGTKVIVSGREYFPSVWDLTVKETTVR